MRTASARWIVVAASAALLAMSFFAFEAWSNRREPADRFSEPPRYDAQSRVVCLDDVDVNCAREASALAGVPVAWIASPSLTGRALVVSSAANATYAFQEAKDARFAVTLESAPRDQLVGSTMRTTRVDGVQIEIHHMKLNPLQAVVALEWKRGAHKYRLHVMPRKGVMASDALALAWWKLVRYADATQ